MRLLPFLVLAVFAALLLSAIVSANPDYVLLQCKRQDGSTYGGFILNPTGPILNCHADRGEFADCSYVEPFGVATFNQTWNPNLWHAFARVYSFGANYELGSSQDSWFRVYEMRMEFSYNLSLGNPSPSFTPAPWYVNRTRANYTVYWNWGGTSMYGESWSIEPNYLVKASWAYISFARKAKDFPGSAMISITLYGGQSGATVMGDATYYFNVVCFNETGGGGSPGGGGGGGTVILKTGVEGDAEIDPSPGTYTYSKGSTVTVKGRPKSGATWGDMIYRDLSTNYWDVLRCTWQDGWCVASLTMDKSYEVLARASTIPTSVSGTLNYTAPSFQIAYAVVTDPEGRVTRSLVPLDPKGWVVSYTRDFPPPGGPWQETCKYWSVNLTTYASSTFYVYKYSSWYGRYIGRDVYENLAGNLTGPWIYAKVGLCKYRSADIWHTTYAYTTFTFTNGTKTVSWKTGSDTYGNLPISRVQVVTPQPAYPLTVKANVTGVPSGLSVFGNVSISGTVSGNATFTGSFSSSQLSRVVDAGSRYAESAPTSATLYVSNLTSPGVTAVSGKWGCYWDFDIAQYVCTIGNFTSRKSYAGAYAVRFRWSFGDYWCSACRYEVWLYACKGSSCRILYHLYREGRGPDYYIPMFGSAQLAAVLDDEYLRAVVVGWYYNEPLGGSLSVTLWNATPLELHFSYWDTPSGPVYSANVTGTMPAWPLTLTAVYSAAPPQQQPRSLGCWVAWPGESLPFWLAPGVNCIAVSRPQQSPALSFMVVRGNASRPSGIDLAYWQSDVLCALSRKEVVPSAEWVELTLGDPLVVNGSYANWTLAGFSLSDPRSVAREAGGCAARLGGVCASHGNLLAYNVTYLLANGTRLALTVYVSPPVFNASNALPSPSEAERALRSLTSYYQYPVYVSLRWDYAFKPQNATPSYIQDAYFQLECLDAKADQRNGSALLSLPLKAFTDKYGWSWNRTSCRVSLRWKWFGTVVAWRNVTLVQATWYWVDVDQARGYIALRPVYAGDLGKPDPPPLPGASAGLAYAKLPDGTLVRGTWNPALQAFEWTLGSALSPSRAPGYGAVEFYYFPPPLPDAVVVFYLNRL